jgi:hypothetical protein
LSPMRLGVAPGAQRVGAAEARDGPHGGEQLGEQEVLIGVSVLAPYGPAIDR